MTANPKITVVVPTYNERESLPLLIDQLGSLGRQDLKVLIVDDNSPDGTGAVADQLAKESGGTVSVLHRKEKDGLGRAYVAGMTRALAENADVIIQMDADLSHPVSAIPTMLDRVSAPPAPSWLSAHAMLPVDLRRQNGLGTERHSLHGRISTWV